MRFHVRTERDRQGDPSGPYRVSHDLHEHHLFDLDVLERVAARCDAESVPGGTRTDPAAAPADVIAGVGAAPGWAVLRSSCWRGEHEQCAQDLFTQIESWTRDSDPGFDDPQMSAIVTSTEAVTPLHLDADESFLLQVTGRKTIVFVPDHVVPPGYLETVVAGIAGRLALPDAVRPLSVKFVIGPGEGVHVPFGWPHFTRVEEGPSVSVSCAFQTRRTHVLRSGPAMPS